MVNKKTIKSVQKTFIAIMMVIVISFGLMLLATNVDYYFGETWVIMGIAGNWSMWITIILSVSIIPFAYLFLTQAVKKVKHK